MELKQRVLEEGCNLHNLSIGPGGSDVYCLEQQDGVWGLFYTERGKNDHPIFETKSEAEPASFTFLSRRVKEQLHD